MTVRRLEVKERRLASGGTARVAVVHADSLDAMVLDAPATARADDLAHHMAARCGRSFIAYALPPHAPRVTDTAVPFEAYEGTRPLSLRAALMMYVQRRASRPSRDPCDIFEGESGTILQVLRERGQFALARHGDAEVQPGDVVPVGSVGFPRSVASRRPEVVAANTHFFVFDLLELDSPLAALGDAVGMVAANGRIDVPPLLPRAAVMYAGNRWFVGRPGAEDLEILTEGGVVLHAPGCVDVTLLYRGKTGLSASTPRIPGAFEVCLQGGFATAIHRDGGFSVPHGAIVLSWGEVPRREIVDALTSSGVVRYRLPDLPDLTTAVQAGPLLVQDGEICLTDDSFLQEGFQTLGHAFPCSPLAFPTDAGATVAARTGVGIMEDGTIILVAIEGSSSVAPLTGHMVRGATLLDTAQVLRDEGAIDAINLDGGGSTQLIRGSARLVEPSDARGTEQRFERPVPVACVLC